MQLSFEESLRNLNAKQHEVVMSNHHRLLVIAGAGSGKPIRWCIALRG